MCACVCGSLGTSQELDGLCVTERITARRKERYMLCIYSVSKNYFLFVPKPHNAASSSARNVV